MKKLFITLFTLLFLVSIGKTTTPFLVAPPDTIIQNFHDKTSLTTKKNEATIKVRLTDFRKNPIGNTTLWVHNGKGNYWQGTTDEKGEVFFVLPYVSRYWVNVNQLIDYRKFSLTEKSKNHKLIKVVLMTTEVAETVKGDTIIQKLSAGIMPTASRALVNMQIRDLNGQPLGGEVICYDAKKSGKVYLAKTNDLGRATLMLPKGETYSIHSYAHRNIATKTYRDTPDSRTSRLELKMLSSADVKKRKMERAALLARRDSILHLQRIQDSIRIAENAYQNFYLQYKYDNVDFNTIETNIKKLVEKNKAELTSNPDYFVENKKEINAILERNNEAWENKRVIANIDCSMYQYIDELMVWNYSYPQEHSKNKYWLFNGFNYIDKDEKSVARRGIFHVDQNDVSGFFKTINKIVNFSCRGSRLENVVEALILGAEGKTSDENLLFIADNYSDVSDLEKLNKLTVPVHIVLTHSDIGVNENYLEIAYQTGGSIHTLYEDISSSRLKNLTDGDRLLIGKFQYQFYKGKFLKLG